MKMDKMGLFGTSGIRGKLGSKLSPGLAYRVGLTAASFFNTDRLIVGYDHRPQARLLRQSLVGGLIENGKDVIDVGEVPTPALLVGCQLFEAPGIILTGSHTPPEIIGILIFKRDTSELAEEDEEKFQKILVEENYEQETYRNIGRVEHKDIITDYMDYILSKVALDQVEGKEVVVDPGNGAASGFLKHGLERGGVNTIAFNDFPDPSFPNRPPFPHPKNLKKLGRIAEATNSIGIATDGDGDRGIFAAENGEVLWGDKSGAIFAADAVKRYKNDKIVITVNSSNVIKWAVRNAGGKPIQSAIGPPKIISKMKEANAIFGIEESGKNIWRDTFSYGDALLSTFRMLEILERTGSSLVELTEKLPTYFMKKIAIECPNNLKEKVLEQSFKKWQENEGNAKVVGIDGKKLIYDDSWLLLRPSGTEPVFRVFAEAKNKTRVEKLTDMGKTLVEEALNKLT